MTATMTTPPAADPAPPTAAAVFHRSFLLVTVRRHRPGFTIRLSDLEVRHGDREIDPDKVRTLADLLPEAWQKRFNQLYGAVDSAVERHTLPFAVGSTRALPVRAADSFFVVVNPAVEALEHGVSMFLERYEAEVVDWNRDRWTAELGEEGYRKQVAPRIPDVHTLRRERAGRFGVEIGTFEIREAATRRLERADIQAHLEEARQSARRQIEDAIGELVEAPRKRLAEEVGKLHDQLTSGVRLTAATFNGTRDAVALCRAFADVADTSLLSKVHEMEQRLEAASGAALMATGKDGDTMTAAIATHKNGLLLALDHVSAACRDASAAAKCAARFGAAPRNLRLAPGGGP